ncbi:MAG: hypothetical protein M0P63_13155 [Azoarcus sp.]|nr:hypothetical protein [Azoarcus sp.]
MSMHLSSFMLSLPPRNARQRIRIHYQEACQSLNGAVPIQINNLKITHCQSVSLSGQNAPVWQISMPSMTEPDSSIQVEEPRIVWSAQFVKNVPLFNLYWQVAEH